MDSPSHHKTDLNALSRQSSTSPPTTASDDQEVELSSLLRELEHISTQTSNILTSIQCCVEKTSQASALLSKISVDQLDTLATSCENFNSQVQYILDLFATLQLKIAQIGTYLAQLPAFEHELDTILKYLPALEQRVGKVVDGIKKGTIKFVPPTRERTQQWEANQTAHYNRVIASPPPPR